jgi:glyoxylase-like metal-dependent hydrolase (beta-lactamase superfamily II)
MLVGRELCGRPPMDFDRDDPFSYATVETLRPWLRRVVARNPSPFTFHGTGTFIVGRGTVAIVDPGPDLPEHVDALLEAVRGETVSHLLVTHTHRDHSPACAPVQAATGAPTYGYGPHGAGKIERGVQVEEGGDMAFRPDHEVRHGDVIEGEGFSFECVYTPGHTSNHLCFQHREHMALFPGDHVMGWNTTIISPPDGDMGDYIASLELLLGRDDAEYFPTHGPVIRNPKPYVRELIAHRRNRERQVQACLEAGVHTVAEMVPIMYCDLPERMYPAAARSVFASVIHLVERGEVAHEGALTVDARYHLAVGQGASRG